MLHFESLGLSEAEKGIAAGIQAAKNLGKAMAFAVADHTGEMIATARMDGANLRFNGTAIPEVYTAALMCRHTLSSARS
jgi:uncharacterized protein GlcG (DUF336 family)